MILEDKMRLEILDLIKDLADKTKELIIYPENFPNWTDVKGDIQKNVVLIHRLQRQLWDDLKERHSRK